MYYKRINRNITTFFKQVLLFFSFPHIWACLAILGSAIITLFCSYHMRISNPYWASILGNISAGLITGLVICLISGFKHISETILISKKTWLQKLQKQIQEYTRSFHKLACTNFSSYNGDESLFSFIYDTASRANWVNSEILQSSYNKTLSFNPRQYCKKHFDYDAYSLSDLFDELHDNVYLIDVNYPTKEKIMEYFEKVNSEMNKLNHAIYSAIVEIDIRLSMLEKTII